MPEPKRPLKVFLCHASTDKPKVRNLYRYLKRRGINPWFDEEHLVGGQDWQVEIPKALATSDAIIICLTKNSVDKEGYIQKEIKFALDKALEMPEGRIFLIPVKFEECEVPFTLSRYQWVDLTVDSGYAKMMKALKFRASQLERSTVEVSKKDVEEENLAREKKEREAAERERQEKEVREKQEREAAEKIARAKLQKEIDKKTKDIQRKYKREIFLSRCRNKLSLFFLYFRYYIFPAILLLGIAVGVLYVWKPFLERNLFPTPTSQTATETVTPSSTPVIPFTSTATSLPTEITDAKGVSMMLVPAGEFIMGSNITEYYNASPAHNVYLESYYIDKYEVTRSLYKDCINAGICSPPPDSDYYYNDEDNSKDNYPAGYIHWDMALKFCTWRDARLPTEAEWEKAARGTDGRTYPWGEEKDCTKANLYFGWDDETRSYKYCTGEYGNTILETGSYEGGKSIYGIYDMYGNVAEWASSLAYAYPYVRDARENLSINGVRTSRGSVYLGIIGRDLHSYEDMAQSPWILDNQGFRCAKDAAP